jgi:hypothetical protein
MDDDIILYVFIIISCEIYFIYRAILLIFNHLWVNEIGVVGFFISAPTFYYLHL